MYNVLFCDNNFINPPLVGTMSGWWKWSCDLLNPNSKTSMLLGTVEKNREIKERKKRLVFFRQGEKHFSFSGAAARLLLGLEKIVPMRFIQNFVLFKFDNNYQSCRTKQCRNI